ncbi:MULTISPECIES: DsbA family oxidoreductase [Streptomyces]|uniref:DsbA family oxidoreductase n=1 Tax=Streptomyces TaxID=1883 RepID=UPI002E304CDD|nr:DsbA family oxidoreductase [Streptomyces canus]
MTEITVDIWSDIVCLWCPIGKVQFDAALAQFEHRDAVVVRHHSYELDPSTPRGSAQPMLERSAGDMGSSKAHAAKVLGQVASFAADLGLDYQIDKIRVVNSFDGHRLVHFAAGHGRAEVMRGRLMAAYTGEGAVLSDYDTLVRLAGEVGLDQEEAAKALESGRYADTVRQDQELAQHLGLRGVPSYLVQGTYMAFGSKSPHELTALLQRAWKEAAVSPPGRGN